MNHIYQVETIDETGAFVHGFSIQAATVDHARTQYMTHPERPHAMPGWTVRVR